jgi:hypothetical protein
MVNYKNAQAQEQSGRLVEAKDLYATCGRTACGTFLARACTEKFTQLDADTPSIIPVVTDESGAPRGDVQVKVDGVLVAQRLDGRALRMEPGIHEVSFVADGRTFATQQVMIVQGQRNRTIAVSMRGASSNHAVAAKPAAPMATAPKEMPKASVPMKEVAETPAPAPEPEPVAASSSSRGRSLVLPLVLGGVGLAGIGGFATLTAWGRKDNDLLGECSPNCPQSSVDHIRRLYIAADISLGVGIAALGTATYLFLTSKSSKENTAAQSPYIFNVQPTHAGGYASVAGRF